MYGLKNIMRIATDYKQPNKNKIPITNLIIHLITITTALSCQPSSPPPLTNTPNNPNPTIYTTISATEATAADTQPTPTSSPIPNTEISSIEEETTPIALPTIFPTPTKQAAVIVTQPQTPAYLVNFLHPELGCQWTGVAGQIFNPSGLSVNGLIVEVSGKVNGIDFLGLGLTGTSLPIGPGGFEIKLANQPFDSHAALNLRIFDKNGVQLNDTLPLTTYNDCRKNLILINFVLLSQPLTEKVFFPIVVR